MAVLPPVVNASALKTDVFFALRFDTEQGMQQTCLFLAVFYLLTAVSCPLSV